MTIALSVLLLSATLAEPPKEWDVPYTLTGTKHVMVRVKLDGEGPYNFIIDTGAPSIFLAKRVAKALKSKTDADGWHNFDSFEMEGGLKPKKVRARVEDLFQLDGINSLGLAGQRIDGVIGYNLLAQYRITYDFTDDVLLWKPLDFKPPAIQRIGGGGQGSLEILGPITKIMASFLGISPTFEVVPRGFIGMEIIDTKEGVKIKQVLIDSPAAKAKLQANDIVKSIGVETKGRFSMKEIRSKKDFDRFMNRVTSMAKVQIEYRRDKTDNTTIINIIKGF